MKRPAVLVALIAAFAAGSAFAASDGRNLEKKATVKHVAAQVARDQNRDRGQDRRNDQRRDNDHRDHDRGHDRRDNDRRDHGRRDDDHRRDNDRRDWDRNHDGRRDRDRNNNGRPDRWDQARRDWDRHPNYWDNRRHDRRDYARYRFGFGHYHRPSGYYYRVWHRGDRLPRAWYGNSYVVHDYRPYRLYAPPYGYHWVRVGNDVLLTALATGVVLDVIYDIWY
jgi:Ni/Co efflux regulator RcnB